MSAELAEVLAHVSSLEASTETLSAQTIRLLAARIRSLVESALVGASVEAPLPPPPVAVEEWGLTASAPSARPLSMTPSAQRARRRRRDAAGRPEADPRQLGFPMDGGRDRGRATAATREFAELSQPTAVATAVAATCSSSSLSDLNDHKKREKQSVTVAAGHPLEDEFRAIFDEELAKRPGVDLNPALVWSGFVAWVVDDERTFPTRGALRRRWRRWVQFERPPAVEVPPESTARPIARPRKAPEPAEPAATADEARELAAAALARLSGFGGPPEQRSASA